MRDSAQNAITSATRLSKIELKDARRELFSYGWSAIGEGQAAFVMLAGRSPSSCPRAAPSQPSSCPFVSVFPIPGRASWGNSDD
jgi:hypothetical protein